MKAFLDDRQRKHEPEHFMSFGVVSPSPEVPARIDILRAAAESVGCVFEVPSDHGLAPVATVHTAEYLAFLRGIHARWQRVEGAGPEVVPNIHPASRADTYPKSATGQAGYHMADTACPISEHTWESAYWSAQSAIEGARAVAEGEGPVYALCRPPGHHAFGDLAGGFCFLNNSAIAAEVLSASGMRTAILDIDVHHGNGTQGIFYTRGDVLTVSIHADPARFYPFFWGHGHERGEDAGRGANLNLPLARGTDDGGFMVALNTALARIDRFAADTVVVALGLDAHEDDPFQGLGVTTDGFRAIAAAIAAAGLPILLVQEGGYVSDALGNNLASFIAGILEGA